MANSKFDTNQRDYKVHVPAHTTVAQIEAKSTPSEKTKIHLIEGTHETPLKNGVRSADLLLKIGSNVKKVRFQCGTKQAHDYTIDYIRKG